METILALDYQILSFIATHWQSGPLTAVMRFITALGDHGILWIVLGLALLLRPKTRRWGITLLAALAVSAFLSEFGIKFLVERLRPFLQHPELTALIPQPDGYSFPSSHATSSFACAVVLLAMKKPVGVLSLCLATLIGFSRVYLCVHFPSDVLVGALLGLAVGALMVVLVRRIADRIHYSRLR